jgi:hypothetical protein
MIAVVLVAVLLKPFSNLTGESIDLGIAFTASLWFCLNVLTILIGCLQGVILLFT